MLEIHAKTRFRESIYSKDFKLLLLA